MNYVDILAKQKQISSCGINPKAKILRIPEMDKTCASAFTTHACKYMQGSLQNFKFNLTR